MHTFIIPNFIIIFKKIIKNILKMLLQIFDLFS